MRCEAPVSQPISFSISFSRVFITGTFLSPYLGLFLDISLSLRLLWMGVCLWYLSQLVNCCCHIERLLIFISLFCILPPCWNRRFFFFFGGIFGVSHHLQTGIVLLLFLFLPLYFPSLVLLLQLCASDTILKRSGDSGQPCLIPDFNGIALNFPHLGCLLWICHISALWYCDTFPPTLSSTLSWRHVGLWQKHFLHLLKWPCDFSH